MLAMKMESFFPEFFGISLDKFDELGFEVSNGCRPKFGMKPPEASYECSEMDRKARKDLH